MHNTNYDTFWTSETQLYYKRTHVSKAEGCYLYDVKGNKYLDANSGTWNVFLGHRVKEIGESISAQYRELDYMSNHQFVHDQGIKLSERLIKLFPEGVFSSVYFTSGGAEAVDTAIKMAKQYWYNRGFHGKDRVISLFESYHGSTIGAVGVSGDPWDRIPFDSLFQDAIHFYPQYCYQCRLGLNRDCCNLACIRDLEYKINFYGEENISALIMEPVMGVGGVIIPSFDYFTRVATICKEHNILLIFDEVTSGLGRCGEYFACMHYGVYPDLLLFGKAISNGAQPLAGVMINEKIKSEFVSPQMDRLFRHGFTNSGHPVACAAGNCVLDIFERDGIIDICKQKSAAFDKLLKRLREYPFIGEIRIVGLMIAIELVSPQNGSPLIIPNLDIIFREKGILLSQMTQVIGIMPPVTMTSEEFESVIDIIIDTVQEYIKK